MNVLSNIRVVRLLIIVLIAVIYGQTAWHGYGLDDSINTALNPTIAQGLVSVPKILSSNYIEVDGKKADYRPVTMVSYALEAELAGNSPAISHVVNVILYMAVCLLLYALFTSLFGQASPVAAALGAILFVVHPVHTEVVASLKNREELFALLFGVAAWLAMIKYADARKLEWVFLGSLCFTLALLSKISIAPLVFIIPLSFWFFRRCDLNATLLPMFVLILTLVLYIGLVWHFLPWEDREYLFVEKPLIQAESVSYQLGLIQASLVQYFRLIIWPYPLSVYYGFNSVPFVGWASALAWIQAGIILPLTVITVYLGLKRKQLAFGAFVFLIALIPVSNIFYPIAGIVVERGLFFPSVGLCMFFGVATDRYLIGRFQLISKLGTALVLITFIGLSVHRVSQWRSYENLIISDVASHPNSAKLHELAGEHFYSQLATADSIRIFELATRAAYHYGESAKIFPEWAMVQKRLGILYSTYLGDPRKAIDHYRKELMVKPNNFSAAFGLAQCYSRIEMDDSTLHFVKLTISLEPTHYESLEYLARYYHTINSLPLAVSYNDRIRRLYPNSDVPYLISSEYLLHAGDTIGAVDQLEKAVKLNPRNRPALKMLFNYFWSKGEFQKAELYRDVAVMN